MRLFVKFISLSCLNKFKNVLFESSCCSAAGLHALVANEDTEGPPAEGENEGETEGNVHQGERPVEAEGGDDTEGNGLPAGTAFLQGAGDGGAPSDPEAVDEERQPGELGVGVNELVHLGLN